MLGTSKPVYTPVGVRVRVFTCVCVCVCVYADVHREKGHVSNL